MDVVVTPLPPAGPTTEVIERKGLGHPDTICDALAENFSRNLCEAYLERFGEILHHNVDKALLVGGRSSPAFGGGRILAPIEIILAGRAVREMAGVSIPIEEIAVEGSREWLRNNLHALDPDHDAKISTRVNPGSQDLRDLYGRGGIALSNDTSIGVGYAPLSPLERLVLDIEKQIQERDRNRVNPAWGEDIKLMAIRRDNRVDLTVACAMIGKYISGSNEYDEAKEALREQVACRVQEQGFIGSIQVNAADDISTGQVYLTVTGTSAEAGDDGEVGRGNRVNGLITPFRPMSLEAAAGKNPRNHVGKIYNAAAGQIAEALIAAIPDIREAHCLLVSRIGAPIDKPPLVELRLAAREGVLSDHMRQSARDIAMSELTSLPALAERFLAGTLRLF